MKYEIMISILFELLSKKCVKASYLSQKYEVSVRSIYRYIESLEVAGIPIYTIRGFNGGFSIVDTFKLSSTFMTVNEFEQTINALTAINQSVPNKVLETAINKLKASIKNEYSGFNLKSGNLVIDGGPWGDTVGYKSKITIISKAIEENKVLSIRYHDRNGEITERKINPYFILFKQGLWYVYAYCHLRNDFRFFKTGRIEYANILSESFERTKIDMENLPMDFWHNNIKAEQITLKIKKKCLSDVEEWLGIENISSVKDQYVATVSLPFDDGLVSKIISFGDGIQVLEPQSLVNKIKQSVKEIINLY